ncbi:MAG: 4-hydroxythreonine-4-phosphate dehydrogenase PdxA [Verrucomicrobiota bacterium]|nr:4-hydroxythreonine-4-phosphate dehydrogenase PdxA [Verrucomicrobiota bacterium]
MKPLLIVTMGDPSGIGPEIAVKTTIDPEVRAVANIVVWGSKKILQIAANKFLKKKHEIHPLIPGKFPKIYDAEKIYCVNQSNISYSDIQLGKVSTLAGQLAYDCIVNATKYVLSGQAQAIVTAPVNKESINKCNINFSGHTELIAKICGVRKFAMMQSSGKLRVVFVTTHISLKEVSAHVTKERIIETIGLLRNVLSLEGITNPKIAIAALNAHAGEGGFMGTEEIDTIIPAIESCRDNKCTIDGPFPPDTLFIENIRTQYDGIISMYHDQGHIPFKMLAFDKGVNSTLGLPIIRTSVDHGTAFDRAWQGNADINSLKAACLTAAKRAGTKQKNIAEIED